VTLPGGRTAPLSTLTEWWDHDNRQGKPIANSARVYEFYGHDWAFPLWDQEFRDFYTSLGERFRWRRRLYIRALGRRLLTGDMAEFGEIPLENGQTIMERVPRVPGRGRRLLSWADRAVTETICRLGLAVVAQRTRRLLFPRTRDLLGFEHWFASGADPRCVRAGDVFEKYGVREALPPVLWSILVPHLNRPVATCVCNALLAAVTLAREVAGER
jgi:hypothetical protein